MATLSLERLRRWLCTSAMPMKRMAVVWPRSVAVGLPGTYGFHRRTLRSSPPVAEGGRGWGQRHNRCQVLLCLQQPTDHIPGLRVVKGVDSFVNREHRALPLPSYVCKH